MSISELITGVRRHLVLLAITLLLGAGVAQLVTMLQPKMYESKASVFVSVSQQAQQPDQAYQGTLFTQERVRSYADLVATPKVTTPVISELGLRMRPDALAKRLSVDVPVNTVLLNISARDSDPVMAAQIANSVTRNLVKAVSELEAPQPGQPPVVKIQVVRPGSVPSGPSSPNPLRNIAIGLILGAIAGVGAGTFKDSLDTRIGRTEDIAWATDMPILGEIPYEGAARKHTLVDDTDPFGSRAEAFRKLRTTLRFIGVDQHSRTIVVSSPRSGDGTSSAALNLAFSLADDGARVVLVDANLRCPSIAPSLGLVKEAGLTSVLSDQAKIADVLQRAKRRSAISVMTSGPIPPNPSELLGTQKMDAVLQELSVDADYVIVDSSPLLQVTDAAVVASYSDGVILIVRAGVTKRDELRHALECIDAVNAETLGVVVNMKKTGKRDGYQHYGGTFSFADSRTIPPSPDLKPLQPT